MNHTTMKKERKRMWERKMKIEGKYQQSSKYQMREEKIEQIKPDKKFKKEITFLLLTLISFHLFIYFIFQHFFFFSFKFHSIWKIFQVMSFSSSHANYPSILWKFKSHFYALFYAYSEAQKVDVKKKQNKKIKQVDWLKCNEIMYL